MSSNISKTTKQKKLQPAPSSKLHRLNPLQLRLRLPPQLRISKTRQLCLASKRNKTRHRRISSNSKLS